MFKQSRKMFWWLPLGRVPDIGATDLHTQLAADNPVQIVDVRSVAECWPGGTSAIPPNGRVCDSGVLA